MNTQATLDTYLAELAHDARRTGEVAARRSDPEGFSDVVGVIWYLVALGGDFTADDVALWLPLRSNAVGAAFSFMAKAGEIHQVGYTTSRAPSRHGGVLRLWRGGP